MCSSHLFNGRNSPQRFSSTNSNGSFLAGRLSSENVVTWTISYIKHTHGYSSDIRQDDFTTYSLNRPFVRISST